jgi:acetylornithine deacetylase/succinyl-diaminopimelate desuccinylase-like protein
VPGESQGGTRSPLGTTLWQSVASFVAEEDPDGVVAPICVSGFTDSHWLRDAFGTIAYGFFPACAMPVEVAATLIHSTNERVPVADLELGVRFLRHVARTYAG